MKLRDSATGRMLAVDPATRFWPKVDKSGPVPAHQPELGPCWVWTAAVRPGPMPYGSFRLTVDGRRIQQAHQAAWVLFVGHIPKGQCVLHRCDNPRCVRPGHLFLGTLLENVQDRQAKGRQARGDRQALRADPTRRSFGDKNGSRARPEVRPRGERHWKAKLSAGDVAEIRRRRAAGERRDQIASHFGVSTTHVTRIVRGENWAHTVGAK